jgi:hypothetical protein
MTLGISGRAGGQPYLHKHQIVSEPMEASTYGERRGAVAHIHARTMSRRLRIHKTSNLWSSNTPSSQSEQAMANGRMKTDCLVNHFNQVLILTSATLLTEDFTN